MNPLATFSQLSAALMAYPTTELREALSEGEDVLAAIDCLRSEEVAALLRLLEYLRDEPEVRLQARYVDIFDRNRRLSLHLFEHVHGEGKERGQAMVELSRAYQSAGFRLSTRELPDYLPALLELSAVAPEVGAPLLRDAAPILALLGERLSELESAYAAVLVPLARLYGKEVVLAGGQPPPPQTAAELDALWQESPVTFGVAAAHDSVMADTSVHLRRSERGDVIG